MTLRVSITVLLLCAGSLAQATLNIPAQPVTSFPIVGNAIINVSGIGFTMNTRLVLNGTELQTIRTSFSSLAGIWTGTLGLTEGDYELWAWESTDHAKQSNKVTLILGSSAKHSVCAGGLLPQSASVVDILAYEAKYNTLNCYYMEPPL